MRCGRLRQGRSYYNENHVVGDPIWSECYGCGKYVDKEGKHVEVETLTLEEMLERERPECEDNCE